MNINDLKAAANWLALFFGIMLVEFCVALPSVGEISIWRLAVFALIVTGLIWWEDRLPK